MKGESFFGEYITTELEKILHDILPITSKRLKNLVHIIIGIILSESVVLSKISQKLKDDKLLEMLTSKEQMEIVKTAMGF